MAIDLLPLMEVRFVCFLIHLIQNWLLEDQKRAATIIHSVHLNAAYDVLNKVVVDVVVQPGSQKNEDAALLELVESTSDRSIFIADRGYESLMTFYKLNHSCGPFVIRIKDEQSSTSILKYDPSPNTEEYDISFNVILTSKNNSYVKQYWDTYKYISSYKKHPEFSE